METTTYFDVTQTFVIENLFKICKLKSLYSASGTPGETQEKTYAITDNERDFFDITLKDAASKVYDAISQDTKKSITPFQYNVSDATGQSVIIYNLKVHADWDKNQSFSLNTAIENSLCDFILKEWYKLRGAKDLFQPAEVNFDSHIAEVKNILNRRIRPAELTYRYV